MTGTQLTKAAIDRLDATTDEKENLLEVVDVSGLHGLNGNEDDVASEQEADALAQDRLEWVRRHAN